VLGLVEKSDSQAVDQIGQFTRCDGCRSQTSNVLIKMAMTITPENLENIPLITFFPETQTITYHNENEM
jgi:hypothetical protein